MKNFIIPIMLVLIGCNQPLSEHKDFSLSHDLTYRAPQFNDPERSAKFARSFSFMDSVFAKYAEENHFPGVSYGLVVDGELIHSGAVGFIELESRKQVDNNTKFHIASETKSFTSMAIVKLRDEGKLNLDDPVVMYIPELENLTYLTADAPHITIKNLMSMSSGLPEDNPWADRQLEETDEEFLGLIAGGLSFSNAPSYEYEYSNLGYAMLGTIISNVTGITYQEYITREILEPLGMTETYWEYEDVPGGELAVGYRWEEEQWKREPMLHSGAFGSIGGLITSLNDMSKYVAYLAGAWPPRNAPETGPVQRSSLREMQTPLFPRMYPNAKDLSGETCPVMLGYAYGLGYREDCKGIKRVGHSGGLPGFGCEYRFYPDYGFGIISFSNRTYGGTSSPNDKVAARIFESGIESRTIFTSEILSQREKEVKEFLNSWSDEIGDRIFAENFYLDESKELRKKEYESVVEKAGEIIGIESLVPFNNLRGSYLMRGAKTDVQVVFTLSPERDPKVQALYYWNVEKGFEIE